MSASSSVARRAIGGGDVGLHLTRAIDQHLEVVHQAEQILQPLQLRDARRDARSFELAIDFHRVAQFLRGDAHACSRSAR